jgi:hypothetical protein
LQRVHSFFTLTSMYEIDSSSLSSVLSSLWQLAMSALRMDPEAFRTAMLAENGLQYAIAILFLGGVSVTLGQSIVLFANRIGRRRFILSLVVFAAVFVFGAIVWAASIWLLSDLVFGTERPFWSVITVVSLSYAPYLFAFLILLPYLGNIISVLLRIWVFLVVIVAVGALYEFSFLQALVVAVLGWVLIELVTHLKFLRTDQLEDWVWRITTGIPQELQPQEIVDRYVELSKRTISDAVAKRTQDGGDS